MRRRRVGWRASAVLGALVMVAAGRVDAAAGDAPNATMSSAASDAGGEGGQADTQESRPSAKSKGDDEVPAGGDACIDENVRADLFAKRKRRDVRERLFQQTNRHEITVQGGYYVSDIFDGNFVVGGAYAYHMTEDFAVEASGAYTRIASNGGPELERTFALLGEKDRTELLFDADLVWDPAHGKLRLGGAIQHFDIYLAAGAGVVDSVLSSDIAGNAALGLKFYFGRMIALRIDLRDHVYRQQLLARKEWVNDVTTTIGISVFLPVVE
jgi:outer membrane beta-barrel protein